jgi:hypothetical protein
VSRGVIHHLQAHRRESFRKDRPNSTLTLCHGFPVKTGDAARRST